jgi:hypothetical protein
LKRLLRKWEFYSVVALVEFSKTLTTRPQSEKSSYLLMSLPLSPLATQTSQLLLKPFKNWSISTQVSLVVLSRSMLKIVWQIPLPPLLTSIYRWSWILAVAGIQFRIRILVLISLGSNLSFTKRKSSIDMVVESKHSEPRLKGNWLRYNRFDGSNR